MQSSENSAPSWHGTTILTVRKGGNVVIGGDGQVSIGQTIVKANAKKVRRLGKGDAMMIVADKEVSLVLTGTGDVLEPEAGVMGIGSGGNYALAAARALIDGPLDPEAIVRKSLDIAAEICVFTNRNVTVEKL
jgi:ATP-dependent HslUV protease subunit HslV